MRLASAVIATLALTSATLAFQDWKGFRFGTPSSGMGDAGFAIEQIASGKFLVAGALDDSICCMWDSVGHMYASVSGGRIAWAGMLNADGVLVHSKLLWNYLRPINNSRWLDLEAIGAGFVSVGSIGDTVLFTGYKRVTQKSVLPETLKTNDLPEAVSKGGGGGIGIGHWTDSGQLEGLQLLRFSFDFRSAGASVGWQIRQGLSGQTTISGAFGSDSAGQVWEGLDSFPVAKGWSCFAFSLESATSQKWLASTPCYQYQHAEHVVRGDKIWLTKTDTFPASTPSSNGNPYYRNWRPGLTLLDRSTGRLMGALWPFGSMQGSLEAIALHENGSMLVQGEQSSDLAWKGLTISPILDTARGYYSITSVKSSYLALLDSNGMLKAFQPLKGFANAGAWKLRRVPGIGWLGLSYDAKDILGWSKLYLFDDSLNVLESSDSLSEAMDVELGNDGKILLTGRSRDFDSSLSWLKGSGSMWAATCRLGNCASTISPRRAGSEQVKIRRIGGFLAFDISVNDPVTVDLASSTGQILYHGPVASTTRLALPLGLSICRITTSTSVSTERFIRW